jgi:hypothetical protein
VKWFNVADRIDHELLLNQLKEQFGHDFECFIQLVSAFLNADIYDLDGAKFTCAGIGIPKVSPISQILLNFFLFQLDKHFEGLKFDQPSLG